MEQGELQELSKRLQEEERSIIAQIGSVGDANPAIPGDFEPKMPSYGDSEDDTINESVDLDRNIAIEEAMEQRLDEVRAAIARIQQGVYGSCEACGSPIEEKRIKAMPTTRNCIHCAK